MAKRRKVPPRVPLTPEELDFGRRTTARAAAKLSAQRLVQPVPAIQQEDDDSDASDDSFTPSSARRSPTPTPSPSPAPAPSSSPSPAPARASPELGASFNEQTPLDSTDVEDEIAVVSFTPSEKKTRAYRKRRHTSSPSPGIASGTKRPRPDKKRRTTSRHRSRLSKTTEDIDPSPLQPNPASSAQSAVSSPTNVSSSFVVSTATAATITAPAANGSAAIHAEIAGYQTSLWGEGNRLAQDGLLGQLDAAADDADLFSMADFRAVTEIIRAQRIPAEEEETCSAEPQPERRSWWSRFVPLLH